MSAQQVFNIHTVSPEKRHLKRHQRGALGAPDLYPQDARQEEDNMTQDRVKRGFIISVPSCEYESMVFNVRNPKFMEDPITKAAIFTKQIIQRKAENNVINLDRKKLKEGTFQQFNTSANAPPRQWFDDLAKKKSLQQLAKKIPFFNEKRREECMEHLYLSKVPIQRALWYLKISQVGYSMHDRNKSKKPLLEQYSIDQMKLVVKSLRDMLSKINSVPQPESSPAYQRWPYFACLFKHAFEEGIVDRQEFLMELCDLLTEFSDYSFEKPQVFRVLITFMSQFVDFATQNVIIARRLGHIVCSRLTRYKNDYDQKKGTISEPEIAFQELLACQHQRAVLLTMFGILHALIVDCPAAFVYNISEPPERSDSRQNSITHQLCGSPLDQFPFPDEILIKHFPPNAQLMSKIVRMRLQEIRQRSRIVETHWALTPSSQTGFEQVVEICINVLSALDMIDMSRPNALLLLYRDVFNIQKTEKTEYQKEMLIRLRICFQWAITSERYGTHRALIVTKLIEKRLQLCAAKNEQAFAGFRIQDILTDFLTHESPNIQSPSFRHEYANIMHLFVELQRHGIFSHDCYVKGLLRCGLLNQTQPIMVKLIRTLPPKGVHGDYDENQSPMKGGPSSVQPTPPQPQSSSQQDPAVISFIPTTVDRSPVLERPSKDMDESSPLKNRPQTSNSDEISVEGERKRGPNDCWLVDDFAHQQPDEHVLLDSPASMSVHERFLIQLPIEQIEENRDACNQRATVLYGVLEERENAKKELLRVAHEITKTWTKRIHVQFFPNSKEVLFKRRNLAPVPDIMASYRQQTYYDQKVIVGWCTDNFMEMIYDFLDEKSLTLPTMEALDILCGMMENCRDIHGIVTLAVELVPQIVKLEERFKSFHSDCMPGIIGSQLAYVLCCYFSEHIDYFLLCKEAPRIINSLLDYFKYPLEAKAYPTTGWSRSVCMFIWHVRMKLKYAQTSDVPLNGDQYSFEEMIPKAKFGFLSENLRYNQLFFTDMLNTEPRRFFCYHKFKMHMPSIEDDHTKFSFVVNAFKVALECGRDYEKLCELANFCSHVSAQKDLATEWCLAIQQFCYSKDNKKPFVDILGFSANDTSTHYTISTFTLLLAAKHCFGINLLMTYLIEDVFKPLIIRCETLSHSHQSSSSPLTESNLCLVLRICTGLVCARDVPFHIGSDEKLVDRPKKPFGYSADLRGLRLLQVCELDACIFPLLSAVCILADYVKKFTRNNDSPLPSFVKCSLLAMCEEEWVVRRVFWICETKDFEAFHAGRHQNTSMGQTLVQVALRRRSERKTKNELMVCNGNSKKSLLEKLFTAINIWNFRATFYEIMLMIKEIPIDSKNAQFAALADALFSEIGRCCRDLFIKAKQNPQLLQPPPLPSFKISQINCYWLVAPLIRACPTPSSTTPSSSIKAKFLKEAATMLEMCKGDFDSNFDAKPSDLLEMQSTHCSAWLLSQHPFKNLILACVDGEEGDALVAALLKQFQEIIQRVKDNPTLPHRYIFTFEREGLLLRLSLIGGLFDSLIESQSQEWALVLFQLLYYGIISADKDRDYFDACYDMLSMIIHNALIPSQYGASLGTNSAYKLIVRKIQKELGDRPIPHDLNCLAQLLPLPKSYAEQSAWDSFTAQSPQKSKSSQPQTTVSTLRPNQPPITAIRLDKFPTSAQKNIIRLLQHTHFIDFPSPGIWGVPHPKDIFLQQPEVEADSNYHMQQNPYDISRQIMPPQSTQQQIPPQASLHQQSMFSPGMNVNPQMSTNQQMPPTPATPSERPIVPQMQQMNQQSFHQQNIMNTMANQPQMPNPMHSAGNQMNMPQQPPPNYMNQPNPNMMPKMNPHQMQQMMPPASSNSMMHQQQMGMQGPPPGVHTQMGINQPAPVNRSGRRKSNTGQNAIPGANPRAQKRKKDSKANLFQTPDYNGGNNPMSQMAHPSTAQFPHAPPSTHQQQFAMHQQMHPSQHPQQHQMWNNIQAQQMNAMPQAQMHQNRMNMGGGQPHGQPHPSQMMPMETSHEGKVKLHNKLVEKMHKTQGNN